MLAASILTTERFADVARYRQLFAFQQLIQDEASHYHWCHSRKFRQIVRFLLKWIALLT
jgi:hypothetical protein